MLANAQRYDDATLSRHALRLMALITQFADNPALRCGDAQMLLAEEQTQLAHLNNTAVTIPAATLSDLVAQQAQNARGFRVGRCALSLYLP